MKNSINLNLHNIISLAFKFSLIKHLCDISRYELESTRIRMKKKIVCFFTPFFTSFSVYDE